MLIKTRMFNLLLLTLLVSCSSSNFIIFYESDTVEDERMKKHFLKEDKDYNSKILFSILKINENDVFFLKEVQGGVLLDKKLTKPKPGLHLPFSYVDILNRDKSYLFKINSVTHKIRSETLKKYKYIYVKLLNSGKYHIVYTNDITERKVYD